MMVVTPEDIAYLKTQDSPQRIDEMIKKGDFIVVSECEIDGNEN